MNTHFRKQPDVLGKVRFTDAFVILLEATRAKLGGEQFCSDGIDPMRLFSNLVVHATAPRGVGLDSQVASADSLRGA